MKINVILTLGLFLLPLHAAGQVSLFGNITIRDDSKNTFDSNPYMGSLDLFYADQYNDRISALVEIVAEKAGDSQSTEVERIHLGYQFSPALKLSVGRFHTPVGRWHREMHHGRILHDTAERPFFLAFHESPGLEGIMPLHVPGFMLTGGFENTQNKFRYEFLVGSSQEIDTSHILSPEQDVHPPEYEPPSGWESDHLGVSVRGVFEPKNKNWSLGISLMTHTPVESGDPAEGAITDKGTELLRQEILGVDYKMNLRRWDFLTEAFLIRNRDKVANRNEAYSYAYYVQTGYRLSEKLKFIYRHARLDFDNDDFFYIALDRHQQYHNVVTARYDINEFNVFKFEIVRQNSQNSGLEDLTIFRIQWAFMIP